MADEKLTNVAIVAIVAMVVVGIIATSGLTATGYAAKECLWENCEKGYVFSEKACKCIPAAKGKADFVAECQQQCGIALGRENVIVQSKLAIDGTLDVIGIVVEDITEGTCDACRDGCENQPDIECPMMLCQIGTPLQTCCENQGLTWCPAEAVKETACMKTCLGVGGGETDCFAGEGCQLLPCCPGFTGEGCPYAIACENLNEYGCTADCAISR